MRKTHRMGALGVLVLVVLLGLLLTAGPATAGAPGCGRTITIEGGLAGELDPGQYYFNTPALANLTVLHWRPYNWTVTTSGDTGGLMWSECWNWSMVLKDKPGDGYDPDPETYPENVIPGWHFHWFTGVVCGVLVGDNEPSTAMEASEDFWSEYGLSLPPKALWLWTTKGTGVTTPAGVHYITEYWTGHNQYEGKRATFTWTMAQEDFQDARGTLRILR